MKVILPSFLVIALGMISPVWSQSIDLTGVQRELDGWAGDRPGAIIALAIDGDAREVVAAGRWSDDEDRLPDEHTAFEIGSITKLFTALLASEAVVAEVLNWDEPLGDGFATSAVTPGMLATHTSGLPALPVDFPASSLTDPYVALDLADLKSGYAATIAIRDDDALPANWSYSNLGVSVLGQAVAAAWGESYVTLLQQRLLDPMAMTETWLSTPESVTPDTMAPGFNAEGEASRWRFDAYAPAGGMVSTVADIERFMRAMMKQPEPWAATMIQRAETGGPDAMGYGWFIREVNGESVFWHGGGTGGYRTFVGVQPATRRGIVVLGARDRDVSGIGLGWFQGLFETPDTSAVEVDLADYLGDYPLAPQFVLRVFLQGERLMVQATAQPAFGLEAQGEDAFALEGVPARLVFERSEAGQVSGLVLHQGGRESPAPRQEPGSLVSDRKGIELVESQLVGLEGEYALAPNVWIMITRSGTQLFARLTGQSAAPIFASAMDEFFYDVVDAQLSFERDESGEVVRVILHQNGVSQAAPRR